MKRSSFFDIAGDSVPRELLEQVSQKVELVEQELLEQVCSEITLVQEACAHTLRAGGKRLRPAFMLLAAEVTGHPFKLSRAIKLGACLEMIHMATLMHDDVIDHAATRRGQATSAAIFGNTASILSGDVLLAKAMRLLAEDGDLEIIRCVSQAVVELAEGEVLELGARGDFELSKEAHLQILSMKTGAFMACCCKVGALLVSASTSTQEALASYGHQIGMAFQIVDDLLDFQGTDRELGKQRATDFCEGQATLPLIFLRPKLGREELGWVREHFGLAVQEEDLNLITGWMETRGAFDEARALGENYASDAKGCLRDLPESSTRDLLNLATELILSRKT